MTLPLPVRIPKAVVGPLLPGSSLLRSVFQADLNGFDLVQYRSEANAPANTFTVKPLPFKWDKRRRVEGVSLYGGPLLHHFGHMVAEGMHRLWAATAFEHLRDARVVFQVKEGADEPPPAWFAGMLELCGIAPERVLLVFSLTQFDELHIPAQGKALHGEILFDGYLDLFPLVPLDDDGPPPQTRPNLYVSRRRHLHTGSVVGETYVETALRAAGFEIVYPENVATPDFVRRLHGAGTIVFS